MDDDDDAISESIRALVERQRPEWEAKFEAFREETIQRVAVVLGLSLEQVQRHGIWALRT